MEASHLAGAVAALADESIRVAELDRRIIARGKYDLDVVGRYARPNIFGLTVDTTPRNAVSFHGPCKNEAGDKATFLPSICRSIPSPFVPGTSNDLPVTVNSPLPC